MFIECLPNDATKLGYLPMRRFDLTLTVKSLVFLWFLTFSASVSYATYNANLPGDWLTFGNGPAHTGYVPGTLNGLPFVGKWTASMPGSTVSQAVIAGGRAYVSIGYY